MFDDRRSMIQAFKGHRYRERHQSQQKAEFDGGSERQPRLRPAEDRRQTPAESGEECTTLSDTDQQARLPRYLLQFDAS